MSGNDYSIIPAKCKEAQINADKHLIGLKGILTLKEMCITYLGTTDTKMWFQEALLSHTNTSWLANNILTISQIYVLSASRLVTGEEKLNNIIKKIEDLRKQADNMISSGLANPTSEVSL